MPAGPWSSPSAAWSSATAWSWRASFRRSTCSAGSRPSLSSRFSIASAGTRVAAPRAQRPRRPLVSYLKISDGCDRRCTFCAIPLIKGRYEPAAPRHILELARAELRRGARELVLVGQDTASLPRARLRRPRAPPGAISPPWSRLWLRLLYLQPESVSAALLEALAAYAVPYVDLPLQHASERVLRAMGRQGSGETYLDLLAQIRRVLPGVAVRSTFIAGFPGETEHEFEELLQFVAEAGLAVAGVFPFDPQEGTAAARLPRAGAGRAARGACRSLGRRRREGSAPLLGGSGGSHPRGARRARLSQCDRRGHW